MMSKRIETALEGAKDTEGVVVGPDAILALPDLFRQLFPEATAEVIADDNTYAAAGAEVQRLLQAQGVPTREPWVLPATPTVYADYETVEKVAAHVMESAAVPIVVGSGTLNDLVKLASHNCERRYIVVGTAASMDGYTAFGASIARNGYKQTFSCPAPIAVVADTKIIASAPQAMTASGFADLLGKVTAGADWILADALGAESIYAPAWSLVQDSLRDWTGDPEGVRRGDSAPVEHLTEGLILTGLAMQAHRNSRPASGSEHQFSHLWEMEHLEKEGLWLSHGFKVGVGSIAVAALYERFLKRDLTSIDIDGAIRRRPSRKELADRIRNAHTLPILKEKAVEESLAKYPEKGEIRRRLEVLQERWEDLKGRLEVQLMPAADIRNLLAKAGCPVDPPDIGLDRERLYRSYLGAQQIRRRYTILDAAVETGTFDSVVNELFAPTGFWGDLQ